MPAADPAARPPLPVLPRVIDVLTVVLVLVATTVALTGGFREWTPFGRLSVTSALRPFGWALILFLFRLWRWPSDPLVHRLSRGLRRLVTDDGMAVFPVCVGSRLGILLVGFLAVVLIGYPNETVPWRMYPNELFNLPARYDAGWYLTIAARGYAWTASRPEGQQNIVFFPLMPMLMRYLSLLMGRQVLWTGVAIAIGTFLWALAYLYRFAREELGADRALAAVTLLAAYPFALFFSAPYTESLFLLTLVATCYHFKHEQHLKAAVWGLLCGLTRPNGCLLSVVLAVMAVEPLWRGRWWPAWPTSDGWRRLALRIGIAAMPGLGMVAYSIFIYYLTGDPLQWTKQQIGWGRVYRGIDQLVMDRLDFIDTHGMYIYVSRRALDFVYLVAVAFFLGTVVPVYRRFGAALACLLLINILPPLMMGGLLSMGRATSVLFPTFLWLGEIVPAGHRTAWITAFAALQGLFAAMFFTWRPIF